MTVKRKLKIKLKTILIHLQTDGVDNYWNWIEETILPSLSSSSRDWAKGCHPLEQYTIDCNSRLVGGARIRQLRVSPGTFYAQFRKNTAYLFPS